MTTRVFVEKGRVKLIGDYRDITVINSRRQDVWDWCAANNITVEYQGTLDRIDLWRVRNEQHRVMFLLKWT